MKLSENRPPIIKMLNEIRQAIGRCYGPSEREILEELEAESEGWRMRLRELDKQEQSK